MPTSPLHTVSPGLPVETLAAIYSVSIQTPLQSSPPFPFGAPGIPPITSHLDQYVQETCGPTKSKAHFLRVCSLWYRAGISVFWETVHLRSRSQAPGQSYKLLSRVILILKQSAADISTNGGFGRFVRRIVIDMDRCPKKRVFDLLKLCPNLQSLTVQPNDDWGIEDEPLATLPENLRRLDWFPFANITLCPNLQGLAAYLNRHPQVCSLRLPSIAALQLPVSFDHIVCLELSLSFYDLRPLATSLSLPALTRLVIRQSLFGSSLAPVILKLKTQLTYLAIEAFDYHGLVAIAKLALSTCDNLEELVLQFQSVQFSAPLRVTDINPSESLKILVLQSSSSQMACDLLTRVMSTDWKNLRLIRLVPYNSVAQPPHLCISLSAVLRTRFVHRRVSLEDWMGKNLITGPWAADASDGLVDPAQGVSQSVLLAC